MVEKKWRTIMAKRWLMVLAALLVLPHAALGQQDYPTRPVSMVVAAAAGGPIDVFTRIMAERMSPILGQRVVVENVGGGGGTLGGQRVAKAAPDGYTMLLGTVATHANPQLYTTSRSTIRQRLHAGGADRGNPAGRDRAQGISGEHVRRVHGLCQGQSRQAELRLGRRGLGLAPRLRHARSGDGHHAQHVPYRGTGPAMQDLIGGRIDFLCDIAVTAVPSIKAGTVKGLATLARPRMAMLPDLPTAAESGLPSLAGLYLDRVVSAEGRAGRDRRQAERRHGGGDERAGPARAVERSRRDPGDARAADAGLSRGLCEERMGQMGRGDPGRGSHSEVSLRAAAFALGLLALASLAALDRAAARSAADVARHRRRLRHGVRPMGEGPRA